MAEPDAVARLTRAAGALARGRRTPFYVFDALLAGRNASRWKTAAAESGALEIFYPYKCNRHPGLLDVFAREGLGAEVSCLEDLEAAVARGIPGDRLILQGPAKDTELLDRTLSLRGWLVADGPEDAQAILGRARALRLAPRYLLRFRASSAQRAQRRFGFPPAGLLAWVRSMRRGWPAPEGLAFHLGTGIASAAPHAAAIRQAARIAGSLKDLGIAVRALDLGGGFAAAGEARRDQSGRPRPAPPPPEEVLCGLAEGIRRATPVARGFLEPGRALASDAFILVTRVIRVSGGRIYVDASRMSHALFVPNGKHRFLAIPRRAGKRRFEVAGPLPVDLDVLSAGEMIGRPHEGDRMAIGSVGAYNVIAANAWAGELPEVVELDARGRA